MMRHAMFAFLLLAPLAACDSEQKSAAQGDVGAAGELLDGSISDAMIPLDTVKSQAPAAASARSVAPADIDSQQPKIRRSDVLVPEDPVVEAPEPAAEPTPDAVQ